jgi:hypothetical protein
VIFTATTGNLELGSKSDDGAGLFGFGYGFFDLLGVGIKVHRPLIEVASSHIQKPHLLRHNGNGKRASY